VRPPFPPMFLSSSLRESLPREEDMKTDEVWELNTFLVFQYK